MGKLERSIIAPLTATFAIVVSSHIVVAHRGFFSSHNAMETI
ncbi:hypothetical protein NIES2104_66460 [Leptolyngbya sp. NIES-2104]|nr:hypothetical protein NIES2104_66460 [Leptolyngbya sp. NIES-2104]